MTSTYATSLTLAAIILAAPLTCLADAPMEKVQRDGYERMSQRSLENLETGTVVDLGTEGTFFRPIESEEERAINNRRYWDHLASLDLRPDIVPTSLEAQDSDDPDDARRGSTEPHYLEALTTTSDGQGWFKQVFGADNRTEVPEPYGQPYDEFVYIILDNPANTNGYPGICSGTFVGENEVLTAAHCIYSLTAKSLIYADGTTSTPPSPIVTDYGTDHHLGYVCIHNGPPTYNFTAPWAFEDECEFIDMRFMNTQYPNRSEGSEASAEVDFAVLRLENHNHPAGLGANRVMAMSGLNSANSYEQKTPISHGYPLAKPDGSLNYIEQLAKNPDNPSNVYPGPPLWRVYSASQMWQNGIVANDTTNSLLKTSIDAGTAQSGSSVFYYINNAGGYPPGSSRYIIGLLTALRDDPSHNAFDKDHNTGPTVREFRSFVRVRITHCSNMSDEDCRQPHLSDVATVILDRVAKMHG